jgi:hypothetical protein
MHRTTNGRSAPITLPLLAPIVPQLLSTSLFTGLQQQQKTRPVLVLLGMQVYAGLNQRTGELMAVKELELVSKHKPGVQNMVMQQLQELQQVGQRMILSISCLYCVL